MAEGLIMPYKWKDDKQKYQREYHKKWYAANRNKQLDRQNERKREIREWYAGYKLTLKCSRCSENHPATLDFHHKSHKNSEVSVLVSQGAAKETILNEISLCEVLCANCHRKEHSTN